MQLGRSTVRVAPLGVGCWAWGERKYWGYEQDFGPGDVVDAFVGSVEAGITFFDTAEVYGHGESEQILGWLVRKIARPLVVATKFALLPGRDADAMPAAVGASLRRLKLPRVDLLQVHWPDAARASSETLAGALAAEVRSGRAVAVGVSNFSAEEMRRIHAALATRGIVLASNQVRYSLLDRAPERDGVLDACRELGVTLLAYSPLAQGVLTGKYTPAGARPAGARARDAAFTDERLRAAQPLLAVLREMAAARGVGPEAVALAWLIARGVVPLAGAKTGAQARANAAALSTSLDAATIDMLDHASTFG